MRSFAAVSLLVAVAGLASAQKIDPTTVPLDIRQQWCVQQKSSCPLLCLQEAGNSASTSANNCDPKTLAFSCVCAASGISPNATEFSLTIPYFECTESNSNCVKNCGNQNQCASACRSNNPCGAKSPTLANSSTSTTTATASSSSKLVAATDSSGSTVYSGFGSESTNSASGDGSGSNSAKSAASSLMLQLGSSFGVAGLVFLGVGVFVAGL